MELSASNIVFISQKIIVRTHEDGQKTLQVTKAKKGGEKFAATHSSQGCLSRTPSRQSWIMVYARRRERDSNPLPRIEYY